MTPRPTAGLVVSAMIRTVEGAGGSGMVVAKGDATAGAILLILAERGRTTGVRERTLGPDDTYMWTASGPAGLDDPAALSAYVARRRQRDPDLWVVELDHADALALAQGVIA